MMTRRLCSPAAAWAATRTASRIVAKRQRLVVMRASSSSWRRVGRRRGLLHQIRQTKAGDGENFAQRLIQFLLNIVGYAPLHGGDHGIRRVPSDRQHEGEAKAARVGTVQ